MFFSNKKKTDSVIAQLEKNEFAREIPVEAKSVTHKYTVQSDNTTYALLYRDGVLQGMPFLNGGKIFPFANDPTKPGTKAQKKKFSNARVVILRRDTLLKMQWGTQEQFIIEDPTNSDVSYYVGASGEFFLEIDPSDAAKSANHFYKKLFNAIQNNNAASDDDVKDFLAASFGHIAGLKLEEYIQTTNKSLANYKGLSQSAVNQIGRELRPEFDKYFAEFGLHINETASTGILERIIVREITN